MKRNLLMLALTALLGGGLLAGGASAAAPLPAVMDRGQALSEADERELEGLLSKLGNHHFSVLYAETASPGPGAAAAKLFEDNRMGPRDGMVVVAVKERRVGVHLGRDFIDRGVSKELVSRLTKQEFFPEAKRGNYAKATYQLIQALIAAGEGTPAPASAPAKDGGFPWGLVVFVAVAGGGVTVWIRHSKIQALKKRLEALRAIRERIVNGALKLDDVDTLAKFQEGQLLEAYRQLAANSHQALAQARAFGERYDAADQAMAGGKLGEAAGAIAQLEQDASPLEAGMAAVLTALERLESGRFKGAEAMAQAALPQRVQEIADQVKALREAYELEHSRARQVGLDADPVVVGHLEAALKHLSVVPVDPERAEKRLPKVEGSLAHYRKAINKAEHKAERARARSDQSADMTAMSVAMAATESNRWNWGSGGTTTEESWSSDSSDSWDGTSDDSW